MGKWQVLKEGEVVRCHCAEIVVTTFRYISGNWVTKVEIGKLGWNRVRNGVIAYMEVNPPKKAGDDGWKSIYWGDKPPSKDGAYLITIQSLDGRSVQVMESRYRKSIDAWVYVPYGYEVFAYKPFPRPYENRR